MNNSDLPKPRHKIPTWAILAIIFGGILVVGITAVIVVLLATRSGKTDDPLSKIDIPEVIQHVNCPSGQIVTNYSTPYNDRTILFSPDSYRCGEPPKCSGDDAPYYTSYGETADQMFKLVCPARDDQARCERYGGHWYNGQCIHAVEEKPIIYLYPTKTTNISVKLSNPQNFTVEYPKYNNGWRVTAQPNGDLVDLNTGRELYALYYESKNIIPAQVKNDGFIVKGSDTAAFLEEKLEVVGLTPHEAEEFIVYWLPQLQNNPYNYIRFQTIEEINQNQVLTVSPAPDSVIRVSMTFKPLDKPMNIQEQKLSTPERKGFVVVEWGGTKINKDITE